MAVRSKERNKQVAIQCCSSMENSKNNKIHTAWDGAQDKKVRVRALGRGTRLKK